jgi:hypothetical protein
MNKLHGIYLKETGGRKISYIAWLEQKLAEFGGAYEEVMPLIQEAHRRLKYGSEAERLQLADEIAVGLKDTGLFDDEQPVAVDIEFISNTGLITLDAENTLQ